LARNISIAYVEHTPLERAAAYRALARSIERTAELATSDEMKAQYLTVARGWLEMAEELQAKNANRKTVSVKTDPAIASLLSSAKA
jgi:hypothetical protein